MYLPLSRLFGFCQDISPVFRGVTHQIILKTSNFSNKIIKSGAQSFKVRCNAFIMDVASIASQFTHSDTIRSCNNEECRPMKSWIRKGQLV